MTSVHFAAFLLFVVLISFTFGFVPPTRSLLRSRACPIQIVVLQLSLLPESNPTSNYHARSQAGVPYADAFAKVQELFPAEQLTHRNSVSRTDGYWPFLSRGQDPPQSLTYGEFDFFFFADLLDHALNYTDCDTWEGCIFCDVGSGTGRLVMAASLLQNWKTSRGIEILPHVHKEAENKLEGVEGIDLQCRSFEDEGVLEADCIFAFSSCFTEETMQNLRDAIGAQCFIGTIVITTDYKLPMEGPGYELELLGKRHGWCWLTGGDSTAYLHRVVKSLD